MEPGGEGTKRPSPPSTAPQALTYAQEWARQALAGRVPAAAAVMGCFAAALMWCWALMLCRRLKASGVALLPGVEPSWDAYWPTWVVFDRRVPQGFQVGFAPCSAHSASACLQVCSRGSSWGCCRCACGAAASPLSGRPTTRVAGRHCWQHTTCKRGKKM